MIKEKHIKKMNCSKYQIFCGCSLMVNLIIILLFKNLLFCYLLYFVFSHWHHCNLSKLLFMCCFFSNSVYELLIEKVMTKTAPIERYSNVCRTCLSENFNMKSVFGVEEFLEDALTLSEILMTCASIQVYI